MASTFVAAEHIAADIVHTLPAFLPIWKRVTKGPMRALINEGRTHLHMASEQLQRVDCKEALECTCGQLYFLLCKESDRYAYVLFSSPDSPLRMAVVTLTPLTLIHHASTVSGPKQKDFRSS